MSRKLSLFAAAALSLAGAACSDQEFTVNLDQPLRVVALEPAGEAAGVRIDAAVVAIFSEEVKPESITGETFFLEAIGADGAGTRIEADVAYDETRLVATLVPRAPLAWSARHRAVLTTGIERVRSPDATLPVEVRSLFTTEHPPAFRLVGMQPAPGTRAAPIDTEVVATFSEELDPATVTAESFRVEDALTDEPIAGERAVVGAELRFTPAAPLGHSRTIRVVYGEALASLRATAEGGHLEHDLAVTFHTEDPPELRVVSFEPGAGTDDFVREGVFSVLFSEPLDPATATAETVRFEDVTDPLDPTPLGPETSGLYLTFSEADARITFDPLDELGFTRTIRVTLAGARDGAGSLLRSARATEAGGWLGAPVIYTVKTIDPPDLRLVQALPGQGTVGAPIGSEIELAFSEPVVDFTGDPLGYVAIDDVAEPNAPTAVAGAWTRSDDGTVFTFTPLAPLAYDTPYRVTLTERVRSLRATDEGGFLAPIDWTFRTEPPPPLTLVAHVPSADALGVNRLTDAATPQPIVLFFSEPVDPITVPGNLFLADLEGTPVPGTATANGDTVTFEPALPLAYSARYTVTATPALSSVRGGLLGRLVSFSFDTLDPPPLRLAATLPSGGALGVARTQPIVLSFSEGVDQDAVLATGAVEAFDVETGTPVSGTLSFGGLADAPTRPDLAGDDVTVTFTPDALDAAWPDVRWPYSRRIGLRLAATIGSDRATDGSANPTGHRGGWLDPVQLEFRIVDPPALLVGDRVPGAGAAQVARTQPIELTFSEGVAQASVIPFDGTNAAVATLRIVDPATGLPLPGTLSFVAPGDAAVDAEGRGADTKLVFAPQGGTWAWSQDVEIRLTTAIRSDRGLTYELVDRGHLADPTLVWQFHVEDPPELSVIAIAPGPSQVDVEADARIAVTFSEALRPASVNPATFVVQDVTGAPVPVAGTLGLEGGDAAIVFVPAAPLPLGGRIQVTLTTGICSAIATPLRGCLPQQVQYHFEVMPVPHLQVVSTTPVDGAQLVPITTQLRVVFNLDVVQNTIDPATNPGVIRIEDVTVPAAPVAVSIALASYDATTHAAVYDVAAPTGPDPGDLAIRTPYRVTVRGGFDGPLTAQAGELIDDHVFDFVTGTNLLVLGTLPGPDATGVPVAGPICIVLDSPVVESSVTAASFALTFVDEFGRTVAVPAAEYDFDRVDPVTFAVLDEVPPAGTANQICFVPDAAAFGCFTDGRTLLYHQRYTATLTAAVLTAGGPLEGGWTWSFTTGAPPLVARAYAGNDVVQVEPLLSAVEVPVNAEFFVEFTGAMRPATVHGGTVTLRHLGTGALVPSTVTLSADGRTARLAPNAALAFLGANAQGYELFVRGGLTGPTDLAGNYLEADVAWRFRTSPATQLVLAVPQGGSNAVNSIIVAELSRAVYPPSLTPATLYLTAGATTVPGLTSPRQDYRGIALVPSTDLFGGTVHTIHITTGLRDFRGNPMPAAVPLPAGGRPGDAFVAQFDTSNGNDPNSPSLSSSVPANGGVLGSGAGAITLNFTEAMNLASFIDGLDPAVASVHLTDHLGNRYTTSFRASSPTSIQMIPDAFLRSGRTYTVTLDRDVSDAARNHLNPTSFTFTVEAVRPTVTSVTPANAATGVAGEANVTARFSERMDPASLHAGTFLVTCAAVPLAGTVTVAADGLSATFDPAAGIPAGSACAVAVTGATDAAGNLVQPFASAFTVVSGPMTVTLSPADGATNVPVSAPFSATFSRAVDPATLVPSTTTALGTLGIRTETGGVEAFGCPAVDPANPLRVEFRCVDPLLPATAYEWFVTAGVRDFAGNAATATAASFTTAP